MRFLHGSTCVIALERDDLLEAVGARLFRTDLDRDGALVDTYDLYGPTPRCGEAERPDVRVRVEDTLAGGQRLDATTQLSLVEVEAGLLSDVARELPRDAALGEVDGRRRFAAHHAASLGEPLGLRGSGRRAIDDAARLEDLAEGLEDHGLAILHSGREDLDDQDVAEAIDDEAGNAVSLGMDDAVARRLRRGAETELLPGGQRAFELAAKQRGIDGRRLVPHQEAHRDRRSR